MRALEVNDLSLGYGDKQILKDINLSVEGGSFVSIIGANGSGKSTLLKGMSRLLKPTQGQVKLFGRPLDELSQKAIARHMAILPQRQTAQTDLSVERLVSFGREPYLSWRKRFSAEDQRVVDWAIETLGLEQLRDRPISQLSGGEAQRVWLAMALAQQPKILFLDEPTTYLDLAHQLEILETIKQLNQEHAITVIMVNHDLNQAVRYSDTIVALDQGRVVYHLPAGEMMDLSKIEAVFSVEGALYYDTIHQCNFFIPRPKSIKETLCENLSSSV